MSGPEDACDLDECAVARLCAWCGCEIHSGAGPDATTRGPSHGICDRCVERLLDGTCRGTWPPSR